MTQKSLVLSIILVALSGASDAYNGRFYYPYTGYYYNYGIPYRPEVQLEFSRYRRDLREQRIREGEQRRHFEQEVTALRQQAFANHQVGARQACYYRTTGGFELCADLFGGNAEELAECEVLVVRRNPGCNELPLTDTR